MILIRDEEYDRKDLDDLILHFKDISVTPVAKRSCIAYEKFLNDCYDLDINIQRDVDKFIGDHFISYVIIPSEETDDFNILTYDLININGDKVKKRDELLYKNICKKYSENFNGLIYRLEELFEE